MSDDTQRCKWQDLWDKTLPVIVGGVLAIAGSYFATTFQMSAQAKAQKTEEQRKVFARLMGRKLVTPKFRDFDLNSTDYQWLAGHSEF
jgi:hypothetical protein